MKTFLGAAALALTTAAPATAAPIHLDFEFADVSGTFFGLDNEIVGIQSSTGFDVDGLLGTYRGSAVFSTDRDIFEFSDGKLIGADFFTTGYFRSRERFDLYLEALVVNSASALAWEDECCNPVTSGLTQTRGPVTFTQRPLTPVPLPAGAWLLLSGLAGVAGLMRWNKPTA